MINHKLLAPVAAGLLFVGALAAGVVLTGGLSQSESASAGEGEEETPSPEETEEGELTDDEEEESDEDGRIGADRFHELLAEELGITVDELENAYTAASLALIDEAEADGRLSAEEADRARERVEEGGFFPAFRSGFHHGFAFGRLAPFEGVAELLGLTTEELRAAIEDGQSLAEVAESAGISLDELTAEVLANVRESLDEAVANGGLTQERADEIYERFESG
ncbi:MAG TPA: hypothetical protein VFZ12_09310, partial [Dehalococcoidia bacterium]|nr:hypothetical protein [Dehalococcoidia bacterium]